MILVIFGLPGSGKTTVAKIFSKEFNAIHLNTDELRKKSLAELGYSERSKRRIYETMFSIAKELILQGKNVCLDGTFYRKILRKKAKKLAKELKVSIHFIEVICEEKVIEERLSRRDFSREYSEADFRVYKIIKTQFEPMQKEHFLIDTTYPKNIYENCLRVINKIRVNAQYENIVKPLIKRYKAKLKQTHISFILLTKKYVYKIKKAVKLSFLDFSTLEKRKKYCELELELNSRFSKELYLGIVGISQNKKFTTDIKSAVEYAVKMKRIKEESLLINLIKKNKVDEKILYKVAKKISEFHKQTKPCIKTYNEYLNLIKEGFQNCFEIEHIVREFNYDKILKRIKNKVMKFIFECDVFLDRAENGFVKDCHGDLKAKNIFVVDDKIYFFDCIEFDPKLRCCDVIADVAFLAVDLDFYGLKELSRRFIDHYIEITKDVNGKKLVGFYKCYRACVNALVEAYSIENPEVSENEKKKATERCKKYLFLALKYLGA